MYEPKFERAFLRVFSALQVAKIDRSRQITALMHSCTINLSVMCGILKSPSRRRFGRLGELKQMPSCLNGFQPYPITFGGLQNPWRGQGTVARKMDGPFIPCCQPTFLGRSNEVQLLCASTAYSTIASLESLSYCNIIVIVIGTMLATISVENKRSILLGLRGGVAETRAFPGGCYSSRSSC